MTNHRLPIVLILGLLAAAAAAPAATLKWEINVGYSGFFRPGEWTPVMVLLDYTTPGPAGRTAEAEDIRGTLEVYTRSVTNNMVLSQRPIELPVSSRQRFMLYVQLSDIDTAVEVVLRSDRGRRLIAEPFSGLNALKPTESLTVIPARNAVTLRLPMALEDTINQKSLTKVAVVDPLYLPDHWFGYSGVNLLLLHDYGDNMLTRLQVDAIADWVKSGGEFWALGGQNTLNFQNQLIEEILPVEIAGTWTKDWAESGQPAPAKIVVSDITARPEARVLAVDPQSIGGDGAPKPFVVRQGLGNGHVVFWAVDFANPLFSISPFFQTCWWSLYPFEVVNEHANFFWQRFLPQMEQKMGLERAMRFPSLILIFLFIVIYALLVGPLNFWMLARRRRMEWGWMTVPLIIGVFTVVIYGYALVFKGSNFLKRDFEIWRTAPGATAVLREAHSFVFSSNRQQVEFTPNNSNGFAAPYDEWDEMKNQFVKGGLRFPTAAVAGGASGAGLTPASVRDVVQTGDRSLRMPRTTVDQWAPAYYEGGSVVEESAPLVEADLSAIDAGSLRGAVVNSSSYNYSHAVVIFNRRVFDLGDLRSGRSAVLEQIRPTPRGIEGLLDGAQAALAGKDINDPDDYGDFVWAEMIRWMMTWYEFMGIANPSNGEAMFVALVENPGALPELSMTPPAKSASRHALIVCPLAPRLAPGAMITLQGPDIDRNILHVAESSYNEFVKGENASLPLTQSSLTLMLTTPLSDAGAVPAEINLSVYTGQPSRTEKFVVNVFNFGLGRWVPFDLTPQQAVRNQVSYSPPPLPAAQYASPINGRAFIRLDSYPTSSNFSFGDTNNITNIDVTIFYR